MSLEHPHDSYAQVENLYWSLTARPVACNGVVGEAAWDIPGAVDAVILSAPRDVRVTITAASVVALTARAYGYTHARAADLRGVSPDKQEADLQEGMRALHASPPEATAKGIVLGFIPFRRHEKVDMSQRELQRLAAMATGSQAEAGKRDFSPERILTAFEVGALAVDPLAYISRRGLTITQVRGDISLRKFTGTRILPRDEQLLRMIKRTQPEVSEATKQSMDIIDMRLTQLDLDLSFTDQRVVAYSLQGRTHAEIADLIGAASYTVVSGRMARIWDKLGVSGMMPMIELLSGKTPENWIPSPSLGLTGEDILILCMLVRDKTNMEIAEALSIESRGPAMDFELGVKRSHLFTKLGNAKNAVTAAWRAFTAED